MSVSLSLAIPPLPPPPALAVCADAPSQSSTRPSTHTRVLSFRTLQNPPQALTGPQLPPCVSTLVCPPPSPCHDPHAIRKPCHVVGQSVSLAISLGHPEPGDQNSPVPGCPCQEATHHVCFIPVSLASTRGWMPSSLPCNSPGGWSCDVPSRPSVWPLAPPPRHLSHLSHQSHACCIFHVVSVWAGGWGPGRGPSGWTAGASHWH